jgi:hypothetical protein
MEICDRGRSSGESVAVGFDVATVPVANGGDAVRSIEVAMPLTSVFIVPHRTP